MLSGGGALTGFSSGRTEGHVEEEVRYTGNLLPFHHFEVVCVHMHSCMCVLLGEDAHV